jgi:AhpD family alkylhydroperoxidase
MNNRVKFNSASAAYKAILGMEQYIAGSSLSAKHRELIKIRASQINACAFCIDMHTRDARKEGETEQRIYALNAWRDTPFFDEQEQSILALTEEMTLISHHHVSEDTYNRAAALFEPQYLLDIMMTVITINSWNRLAITTGLQPMAGH